MATGSDHFELNSTCTNPVTTTAPVYTNGAAMSGGTLAGLDATGAFLTPPHGLSGPAVGPGGGEFAFDASLSAVGAPSVVATINPNIGTNGQSFTITATVTPGVGTVTNVSVDLTPLGGSVNNLVLESGNVYTNTLTVPYGGFNGTTNLTVTVTDTTPLVGQANVIFTVFTPTAPSETASLVEQPSSGYTEPGLTISFTASYSGTAPLAYQWQYSPDANNDFTNLSDTSFPTATNATLVFASATAANSGYYQVVVTNLYGTATSEYDYVDVSSTPPLFLWQTPVPFSGLTANQILTPFPGTYIAGAVVAQNGGNPITVTDSGDSPSFRAGERRLGDARRRHRLQQQCRPGDHRQRQLQHRAGRLLL